MKTSVIVWCILICSGVYLAAQPNSQPLDSISTKSWEEFNDDFTQLFESGSYKEALPVAEQTVEAARREFGNEHENLANSLSNLGATYYYFQRFSEAIPIFLEAKKILAQTVGTAHYDYGACLNNLAYTFQEMGQLEASLGIMEESLTIAEETLGKQDPEYIRKLGKVAELELSLGQYEAALASYQQAYHLAEQNAKEDELGVGEPINGLSRFYQLTGQYEKALEYSLQAVALYAKHKQAQPKLYGYSLNNLASVYTKLQAYEKALPVYLKGLELIAQTEGEMATEYATSLHNMGVAYSNIGDHDNAIKCSEQALAIYEKSLGKDHYYGAIVLGNISTDYQAIGDLDKALDCQIRAATIIEQSLGQQHPRYGNRLWRMAWLYYDNQQYEEALQSMEAAVENSSANFGTSSLYYGKHLHSLGRLHKKIDNLELAQPRLEKGMQIIKEKMGVEGREYGIRLLPIADLYHTLGVEEKAKLLFEEINNNQLLQIERRFTALNDRSQAAFLNKLQHPFNAIHSFCLDRKDQPESAILGYNNQLVLKGLLQGNRNVLLNSLRNHPKEAIRQQYEEWESLDKLLASQYLKTPKKRLPNFDSLKNKAEQLEIQLANASLVFQKAKNTITWDQVAQELEEGEAAIEFSHFNYYKEGAIRDSVVYVAYLIRPEWSTPKMIYLFEEEELAQKLRQSPDAKIDLDQIYASRGVTPRKGNNNKGLYSLVWEPLAPELEGVKTIFYAPSGLLHRINLGAMEVKQGEILFDRMEFITLGSTRSLVYTVAENEINHRTALLIGGVDFDEATPIPLADTTSLFIEESLTIEPLIRRSSGTSWSYLPGTQKEVESIGAMLTKANFEVDIMNGSAAREDKLKRYPVSPTILHIATHGYFFPDPKTVDDSIEGQRTILEMAEHPMVRSGLILAGANKAWTGQEEIDGGKDGILTAYEISQMDLSNTELVVLSACETGLGDIEGNEGVYGLQRAFKIAGAKYVIMSLWEVPDEATQELMTLFYKKWLSGEEIRAAFAAAQNSLRKQYDSPYYWAAFVLIE